MKLKYRVIERFRGTYAVEEMCKVFQVSRSGYYSWRVRQNKAPRDQWLVDLILECQQKCNQTYGCRRVKRWLARFKGKKVNLKAILRILRKLDMLSQIRRRTPYTRYKQGTFKYNNLLNRQFLQKQPNKFWVTDITYIPIPGRMLYMCAVLDLCGRTVLAWRIGDDMTSSLVTDTVRDALIQEKALMDSSSIVTKGLNTHPKHTLT